jgi:hypothetical protein
VTRTQLL